MTSVLQLKLSIKRFIFVDFTCPIDTGCKLDVHKTFRRRPGRPLNVLCTFNLHSVSTGWLIVQSTTIEEFIEAAIYFSLKMLCLIFTKQWSKKHARVKVFIRAF